MLTAGSTYIIVWDNVIYELQTKGEGGDGTTFWVGNAGIMDAPEDVASDEPFIVFSSVSQTSSIALASTPGPHTFSISEKATVVHKIDPKFMPGPDVVFELTKETVDEETTIVVTAHTEIEDLYAYSKAAFENGMIPNCLIRLTRVHGANLEYKVKELYNVLTISTTDTFDGVMMAAYMPADAALVPMVILIGSDNSLNFEGTGVFIG